MRANADGSVKVLKVKVIQRAETCEKQVILHVCQSSNHPTQYQRMLSKDAIWKLGNLIISCPFVLCWRTGQTTANYFAQLKAQSCILRFTFTRRSLSLLQSLLQQENKNHVFCV